MKKILLVTIMSLGIANISYAGFFDNKCTPVEKHMKQMKQMVAEREKLVEQLQKDKSRFTEIIGKSDALRIELGRKNQELKEMCEKVEFQCSECEDHKKRSERAKKMEQNDRESFERAAKMLQGK